MVRLVSARLPLIQHGNGVRCVYVCGVDEASSYPPVRSGTMSSDASSKCHFQVGLGCTEQENSVMVPQGPKNQPCHPPTPTKNTMQVIVLCKMSRKMEGRKSRRSRDRTLCLGTDHWAAGERTTQLGSLGRGCCQVLGFSVVRWVDSALEKQDWVNIRLPFFMRELQGGLRLGPWRSPSFSRPHARLWLTWVHP